MEHPNDYITMNLNEEYQILVFLEDAMEDTFEIHIPETIEVNKYNRNPKFAIKTALIETKRNNAKLAEAIKKIRKRNLNIYEGWWKKDQSSATTYFNDNLEEIGFEDKLLIVH